MGIEYKDCFSLEDYAALRESVDWAPLCPEQVQNGLDSAALLTGCYDDGRLIGCTRLLWDGGVIAYLGDVMVDPRYQGHGIGHAMVRRNIDFLNRRLKPGWKIKLVLFTLPGLESFYTELGFSERPNDRAGAGMDLWLSL